MNKLILLFIMVFLMQGILFAETGYITEVATGHVISKYDLATKPSDTEEHTFTTCSLENMPDLYEAPAELRYDADTLISWAFSQVFVADLIPHMAAFLDFANKATETSKANFMAYATAVGLSETAAIIVNKAVELNANIEAV
jgi:hypothetical protein